ncbi:MAG TPA: DNA mismatch repair endonuclease MutL [Candidatus Binatia bacterium]|nr:DNA mismatch repair endonuclease MutL [Candidatus Binatia bacterium]
MGRIAVLPADVQGQIAAGEVVERPASVVKELVENALDAGARRVEVRLDGGGLERILVRDDGEGMAPDDAVLAFARHATSKLARADDLAGVATLGFRGEALPSIAAVARVRLTTRRAGSAAAAVVEADTAGARPAGVTGAPPGTTVEVHDLFAATPARRKFLRTAATEVGHVVDALTRLAVASPEAGFRLQHGGRTLLDLPPVRDLGQRLAQVLGPARAGGLARVEALDGAVGLAGFLGPPRETLANARLLWCFVAIGPGGAPRFVRDKLLLRAVLDGYASLLMRGRYPVAVLVVRVAAGEVDVNVHPAKLEVRFRRPAVIHQLIAPALRARLTAALRTGAVAGGEVAAEASPGYAATAGRPLEASPPTIGAPPPVASQAPLWQPAPRGFTGLRVVGQVLDGYIVCEGDGRVILIDQHAAHERVLFERLRRERAAGAVMRDALLVPEAVTLAPAEAAALAENSPALAVAGFEGEPFGEGAFLLRTVPRLLRGRDVGGLVRALAAELADEGTAAGAGRAHEAALATVACHGAVRVGQRLAAGEVRALLEAMDGVDVNAHCPHGRPVAVEIGRAQLETLFRR